VSEGLAVRTTGLVKEFGSTRAVDGIDLEVPAGTVYALLGPNGAGKTTTVRMLATLARPDAGRAQVFGHDTVREADAVRSRVGLTGQYASVDEDLTGAENLELLGRLAGYPRALARERGGELLTAFGLAEAARKKVKNYSGGMRRRLDIAASLVNVPDLLFLDEPTTGLDPRSRSQVWDIVRLIVEQGTTVLLTTQYLEEADRLAGRVAVIDHGRVIAEGTPGELKAAIGAGSISLRLRDAGDRAVARAVLERTVASAVEQDSDPLGLTARLGSGSEPAAAAAVVLRELADAGVTIDDFALGRPSLDQVFLSLTSSKAA
jgi:ABC-2 type transport system ATP-binding protein